MAEIKKETEHTGIENVSEVLTSTEAFIEKNKKIITIIVIGIFVIVGGYVGIKKYYFGPLNEEAYGQMFVAEQYFQKDSFEIALNGDGNNWGFKKIIDEYGSTDAANLAHYYSGICYLKMGRFQNAIDQLDKFKADDRIISPIAIGATGDAYVELGNKEKSLKYYLKAAKKADNEFVSPVYLMKAGGISEALKDYSQALSIYENIKKNYPMSTEAREIDKYISRAKVLSGK
jgi:tetratricopeptide (TPR) repeat protein